MSRVFKFYLNIFWLMARDKAFRAHAWDEIRVELKQFLPARLVTPRRDYVFCRYLNSKPSPNPPGRWLPPQSLPYRLGAYGLLFDAAGRLLMVRGESLSFSWNLPGGKVMKAETLEIGLQREFEEETGLRVKVGAAVATADNFCIMPMGRAVHAVLHFYLVEVTGGELRPAGNGFDTTQAAFLDPETIPDHELSEYALIREVIPKAQTILNMSKHI